MMKTMDDLLWYTNHIWNRLADENNAKKFKSKEHQDKYISWRVLLETDLIKQVKLLKRKIKHERLDSGDFCWEDIEFWIDKTLNTPSQTK